MALSISAFIKAAPNLYKSRKPIEIVGAPGSAKTSSIRAVAAAMSIITEKPFGLEIHELSTMDVVDVRGYLFPSKSDVSGTGRPVPSARFTYPTVFPTIQTMEVYENGVLMGKKNRSSDTMPRNGIVFLDEFPQCDQLTQKAICPFILEGRIGGFKLPEGWVVWAAGNRMVDKAGVTKRLSMLQNRLVTLELTLDYESWEPWANMANKHPLTITFAKRYPSLVFIDAVPAEPGPFCTARSLDAADAILQNFMPADMPVHMLPSDETVSEIIAGTIGDRASIDYLNHIRLANDLPDLEIIAAKPDSCPIPERADGQFILAQMLAHHVTRQTGNAFLKYMQRLSEDVQVLFVRSATQKNAMILGSKAYSSWITRNQVLLNAANTG